MSMFDTFKRMLGLNKKKEKTPQSMVNYASAVLDREERHSFTRQGHVGQKTKALQRRRARNKMARKSRRINRKRVS
jgi:hypothetical protein